MFCPKCGTKNPDNGRFCRSCGTGLAGVLQPVAPYPPQAMVDRKGRPITWDRAVGKLFSGIAFAIVAIVLSLSGAGKGWWFWMLIPALASFGAGISQIIQLRMNDPARMPSIPTPAPSLNVIETPHPQAELPPRPAQYETHTKYETGDLVPPSVTENTTRLLDLESEGKTKTLPKD